MLLFFFWARYPANSTRSHRVSIRSGGPGRTGIGFGLTFIKADTLVLTLTLTEKVEFDFIAVLCRNLIAGIFTLFISHRRRVYQFRHSRIKKALATDLVFATKPPIPRAISFLILSLYKSTIYFYIS